MRRLQDIPNTDAPSSDYPGGRIRNKNISNVPPIIGTPIVEELYGDIIQFFQRLLVLGSVTVNNLADNVTNGYQTITALWNAIRGEFIATNEEIEEGTNNTKFITPAGLAYKTGNLRVIEVALNSWNMDTVPNIDIAWASLGLDPAKVKKVEAFINDDSGGSYPIHFISLAGNLGGSIQWDNTIIRLNRVTSGFFDNPLDFGSTAIPRGYLFIHYKEG